jgi:hypothetical protein
MDTPRRETVIRLDRAFDLPAARMVEHTLRRMAAGDRVRIDFGRVQQFHDFAVAVLAQALAGRRGVVVKVEGLRMHQVRLLRYFGVDADAFRPEPPPASTPPGRDD